MLAMMWTKVGALVMFAGVLIGAFGAHGLKLAEYEKSVYQTGVLYHLIHGLALFIVAWRLGVKPDSAWARYAGVAFLVGILLFSGSLYLLSITGLKKLGMITPLGGLLFLLGWLLLAIS